MTRTYAAKRLLEHGPLTMPELREITGWDIKAAWGAMEDLLKSGLVEFFHEHGTNRRVYRLAGQ